MGRRPGGATLNLCDLLGGPVDAAARALLGCLVSLGPVTVRLTETEAYGGVGQDPASHAHRGPTRRNAVMFGPPGHAYVYFTYGMHWCLNVVCGPVGTPAAVLLRAGAVVAGVDHARARRHSTVDRDLARGPARLTVALGVDGRHDGRYLLDDAGPLRLRPPRDPVYPAAVRHGPRVGVAGGHDTAWRFWLAGEPTVSPYRRHAPRRPAASRRPPAE